MALVIHPDCKVQTVRCGVPGCDHVKGEANHWFAMWPIFIAGHTVLITTSWKAINDLADQRIGIEGQLCQRLTMDQAIWAVCGAEHVQKMTEKFIATGKL